MTRPCDPQRLKQALHFLDADKREVFLAHCVYGQGFAVIAAGRNLTLAEVEQLFADAMFELIASLDT